MPVNVKDPINLMVYSPAGHGKTVLLGSGVGDARICPMLFLDFESGKMSIKSKIRVVSLDQLKDGSKPTINKIDVVEIHDWEDYEVVGDYLASVEHPYKTIAIDSLSEVNYMNMEGAIENGKRARPSTHDADIAEMQDYLRSYAQMRRLIRFYRDLPLHTIFSASAEIVNDPGAKRERMWPLLNGKLRFEVPGLVDILGYLAVVGEGDELERWLLTQPTDTHEAKDRTEGGKLGSHIVNPTLPKIFDLIYGEEKKHVPAES